MDAACFTSTSRLRFGPTPDLGELTPIQRYTLFLISAVLAIAQAETAMPYHLGHDIPVWPSADIRFDDDGFKVGGVVAGVVESHVGLRCVVVYVHCSESPSAVNPTVPNLAT